MLFTFGSMLQNFAPFPMNMSFYISEESLTKDPSGGLLPKVCNERFCDWFRTISTLLINNATYWYDVVAFLLYFRMVLLCIWIYLTMDQVLKAMLCLHWTCCPIPIQMIKVFVKWVHLVMWSYWDLLVIVLYITYLIF